MKWEYRSEVQRLLGTREELILNLARIGEGKADATIVGHYQRHLMSLSNEQALDRLLAAHVRGQIDIVDKRLSDFGITIEGEVPADADLFSDPSLA